MKPKQDCRIEWSGCWEVRAERTICRWIVAWSVRPKFTVGAIGGYSGGGAFQLEKFVTGPSGVIRIEAFENIYDGLAKLDLKNLEDCLDCVLDFHEQEAWTEAETLYLRKDLVKTLTRVDDLLLGSTSSIPESLGKLFSAVGLITAPDNHQFSS